MKCVFGMLDVAAAMTGSDEGDLIDYAGVDVDRDESEEGHSEGGEDEEEDEVIEDKECPTDLMFLDLLPVIPSKFGPVS